MNWARADHAGTLLSDGRVLLTGGSVIAHDSAVPWSEVFDPVTRSFERTDAMKVPRVEHVAALLHDGRVAVAGGFRAGMVVPTATAEIWSPEDGQFVGAAPMTVPRGRGAVAVVLGSGELVVLGGTVEGEYGTATPAVESLDPRTLRWERWQDLQMSRTDSVAHVREDGGILVMGGNPRCCDAPAGPARWTSSELVDPESRASRLLGTLPTGIEQVPTPCLIIDASELLAGSRDNPGQVLRWRDGRWERPLASLTDLVATARNLALSRGDLRLLGRILAYEIVASRAFPDEAERVVGMRSVVALADGRALVTGGIGLDLRAVREAWIVARVAGARP